MVAVAAPHVRKAELHLEMLLRERARRSLAGFVKYRFRRERRRLQWNWHLDYLCEVFEAITRRQLKRTIINIPPRHLKTEVGNESWQPWMIGNDDSARSSLLSAGTAVNLAIKSSRKSRDIIDSPWYGDVFPEVTQSRQIWNAQEWETQGGAYRLCNGVNGTIVGRGAAHLLWDDILKPKEANSDVVRTKVCDWLGETLRTRLNDPKDDTITGIMQRLHELDPTGYLMEQAKIPGADQYEHIVIETECSRPRIYTTSHLGGEFFKERKAGELLHEERLGAKEIAAYKVALGKNYEGQYNQRPVKMAGNFYLWDWFVLEEKIPKFVEVYQVWDYAVTAEDEERGAYSVCTTFAIDEGGDVWILDVYRARIGTDSLVEKTFKLKETWQARIVYGEEGVIQKCILPFLRKRKREMGARLILEGVSPGTQDKVMRSHPFRELAEAKRVHLPKYAGWLPDFKLEVTAFPQSTFKDQCDTLAYIGILYDLLRAGERVTEPTPEEVEMRKKDPDAIIAAEVRERIKTEQKKRPRPRSYIN